MEGWGIRTRSNISFTAITGPDPLWVSEEHNLDLTSKNLNGSPISWFRGSQKESGEGSTGIGILITSKAEGLASVCL